MGKLSDGLECVRDITTPQAYEFAEGFAPPPRNEYQTDEAYSIDLEIYWKTFNANLRAAGISPSSTMIGGCLPPDFEASLIEFGNDKMRHARNGN